MSQDSQITLPIKPLDQITDSDASRIGAKAYNCGCLKQAGFPVPDGLAVAATATDAEIRSVPAHPWFDTYESDAAFAVRSSGLDEDGYQQSFAGMHETFLNVPRSTLIDAIFLCRSSAHSAQALAYRHAKNISTDSIRTGILIQRMIRAVAAGVGFTINPITEDAGELVINSVRGLGDALVRGQVEPDEFHVRKNDGAVLSSLTGDMPDQHGSTASLTVRQLSELTTLLIAIERHYGAPQDVEWCHDGSKFWIVQARPITTRGGKVAETEWTRANLVEVLPELTSPQALEAYEDLLNRAERRYMGRLMAPEDRLGPMIKPFYGRLYFNLSQLRHVCSMTGTAPAVVMRAIGHAGEITPADERISRPSLREWGPCIPDIVRIAAWHLRAAALYRRHQARVRSVLEGLGRIDPRTRSDEAVWSVIERSFRDAPDNMQIVLLFGGVLIYEAPLRRLCEKVGFSFEQLIYPQLAAGPISVSAQQAFDLVGLANVAFQEPAVVRYLTTRTFQLDFRAALRGSKFLVELDRFLAKYGHRGLHESDWSLPRYVEDPSPILRAIRAHLRAGATRPASLSDAERQRAASDAWFAFEMRLTMWQRWTVLPWARWAAGRIKQYYLCREQCRSDLTRVASSLRQWHLVLADRFVERGWLRHRDEYFLLHFREVAAAVRDPSSATKLGAMARSRSAELGKYRRVQMPLVMHESDLARLIRSAGVSEVSTDSNCLTGTPVSTGCVEGDVVVVHDPSDFSRMTRGAVLVARATDPSWTPLFTLASGVIVEVGGVLSHASTIAREYGLPALANVKHATRRLRTGERVKLDATSGVIHRMPAKSSPKAAAPASDLLSPAHGDPFGSRSD